MNYQLEVVKRGRKCGICKNQVKADEKVFTKREWVQGMNYPVSKSICLNCAKKLTDETFVKYLESLLQDIKALQQPF